MPRDLRMIVAILRSRDGRERCLDTDVICLQHGATSAVRASDVTLTLAEAIDLAEGEGVVCDYCGAVIVAEGEPVTEDVVAAAEHGQ